MSLSIPYYPLIIVPAAVAAWSFWQRARRHIGMLRLGRPLDRSDHPLERIRGLGVFVFGQKRLLRDPGPGLMHFFIFWGFIVLLATTGNYLTNGLVETVVAWPMGGILWTIVVFVANLFIGLIIVALGYAAFRRLVTRPTRLALSRDAFVILLLILGVVVTEAFGDAFRYVANPDDPTRGVALLAGPLSLALEGIGADVARIGFGVFAWAHILFVLGFGSYLPHSKHLHILTSEPNVYFRNIEPRGGARERRGGHLRCQDADRPHLAAPARPHDLHRVRPLHGILPRVDDGQDAQPQALHGRAARPDHHGGNCDRRRGGRTACGEGRCERRCGGGGQCPGTRPRARQ
jgi:hypothetical protein